MADFCRQCSEEMFGEDFEDLKGLIAADEVQKGFGACVLCEGCGATLVDSEGNCISKDCLTSNSVYRRRYFGNVDISCKDCRLNKEHSRWKEDRCLLCQRAYEEKMKGAGQ